MIISRTFESTTKIFTIHILAFRLLIMEKCNTKYYKRDCHTDALRNYRLNSYYCLGALLLESRSKWSDFINNSKPDICWTFLLYVFPCKPVYILDTYLYQLVQQLAKLLLCRVFMIYIEIYCIMNSINKYVFSSWYKSMPIWKYKTRDITKAELGVTILFLPHTCIYLWKNY